MLRFDLAFLSISPCRPARTASLTANASSGRHGCLLRGAGNGRRGHHGLANLLLRNEQLRQDRRGPLPGRSGRDARSSGRRGGPASGHLPHRRAADAKFDNAISELRAFLIGIGVAPREVPQGGRGGRSVLRGGPSRGAGEGRELVMGLLNPIPVHDPQPTAHPKEHAYRQHGGGYQPYDRYRLVVPDLARPPRRR